jgi:hypothetical protein
LNITITRGAENDGFDASLRNVLMKYVYDKADLKRANEYLDSLVDEDGIKFSRNFKSYAKINDAMVRFSDPDYSPFSWNRNYQKALSLLKEEFSQFKLTPISYHSDDDVRNVLPKANTHSGFFYLLSGRRNKGDNMEGILSALEKKSKEAIREGNFNTPIMIAFRTQASGEYDDDGSETGVFKHKTRVVSMVDLLWAVAEFRFMKPLQKRMSSCDFYAGGKDDHDINTILIQWRDKFKKFISLDYSSFDQTISGWLLRDAYSIMKEAFIMTPEEESLWYVLVNSAIHKDFILAEGILHSDRGMPSGLPSTQIGDTIVNRLIALTYFISINEDFRMMAMGDDNIMYTNADVDLKHFASYVAKNFGMIVKTDDKSSEGLSRQDPKFLSRFWTVSGTWRHPHQIISRMLFPERFRDYSEDGVTPEMVIWGYILAYPKGMMQLLDVRRFASDFPIPRKEILSRVDSHYVPGVIAYNREYLSDDSESWSE